jgi:HEAT repeat protein
MDEHVLTEDRLVVDALRRAGIVVNSSQDLMHTREPYPKAIPVLLDLLPTLETYAIREVVVRALGTRDAKRLAGKPLVAEFKRSLTDSGQDALSLRWAIANTLEILGGANIFEDIARLLATPDIGSAKGLLAIAAAKTKDRRAIPILLELLEDPQFRPFAANGLGLLRAQEAAPKILDLAASGAGNSWQQREFRNALKRLGIDPPAKPAPSRKSKA